MDGESVRGASEDTVSLSDFKQQARIRDGDLLRELHLEWRYCVICLKTQGRLSLHHVVKHPRDDIRSNLVMLCGDGVRGCHGKVEQNDPETCRRLDEYIRTRRPDILEHIAWRRGR